MPGTEERKSQQSGRTVKLLPGLEVRERFAHGYGFLEGGGGAWTASIDTSSGTPSLKEFSIKFRDAVPIEDLLGISLPEADCPLTAIYRFARHAWLDEVVRALFTARSEGVGVMSSDMVDLMGGRIGVVIDEAEIEALRQSALESVTNRGGRPRVSDELKLEVLDAYQSGGIEAAMALSGVKERRTRDYIREAKVLRAAQKES